MNKPHFRLKSGLASGNHGLIMVNDPIATLHAPAAPVVAMDAATKKKVGDLAVLLHSLTFGVLAVAQKQQKRRAMDAAARAGFAAGKDAAVQSVDAKARQAEDAMLRDHVARAAAFRTEQEGIARTLAETGAVVTPTLKPVGEFVRKHGRGAMDAAAQAEETAYAGLAADVQTELQEQATNLPEGLEMPDTRNLPWQVRARIAE